ncbi:hypothetical protein [Nocardia ninae]|uniref:hypothetical protein n=1 Tax=Nocardia ninae TaxID=356145 RepID=UPI001649DFEE|nr:hypothetical protein [Nocardia ninae]
MRALGVGKRGPIWPVMGGSGEGDPSGTGDASDAAEGNAGGKVAGAEGDSFAPITSKADLDAAIQAAVDAAVAPFADYAEVKTRAAAFDQAEAEKLPELERERQRADQAERAAAELRSQNARHAVAEATSVPADILAGPAGADDAALQAYAARVIAWRDTKPGMRPNPQQGQPSETTKAQTLSSGRERFESRRKK